MGFNIHQLVGLHMVHGNTSTTTDDGVSRRRVLKGAGGVAAAGLTTGLAGCTGGQDEPDQEIYVVSFHWGFRMVSPDGSVMSSLDMAEGERLKIYGVNLEPIAEGEDIDIPDAVASAAESGYEDWEHSSLERIAPELGMSEADLEEELETAEEQYKDHALAVVDPGGTQAFNVDLPGDMSSPIEETVTLESTGAYDLICTVFCGTGHPYMTLEGAINVS